MDRNREQSGFSLVELLVATAIIAIVIMMSSDAFTVILGQSGQQTKVAGSGMESAIGLRMLRYDIEYAGYGLPGQFQNGITYSEAAEAPASDYNDSGSTTDKTPRPILLGEVDSGTTGFIEDSDYLVIKSTLAGTSDTAQKWTYIIQGSSPKSWGSAKLDLTNDSKVIVIKPGTYKGSQNELVMNGSSFYTTYSVCTDADKPEFKPKQPGERYIIYGVDDTDLQMPFNRTDYYIATHGMSPSCAPNTGVLYKAAVSQNDGELIEMPIMDCVADMQVALGIDQNGDGTADLYSESTSGMTAKEIRDGVREVRVYILAQEGQKDPSYRHTPSTVIVGETIGGHLFGREFNLATNIGSGWQNYRWKLYTLVVTPKQLQSQ